MTKLSHSSQISNRFANGEYRDFKSAVTDIKTAYEYEKSYDDEKGQQFWQHYISDCGNALRIYEKHVAEAERLALEEMKANGLDMFAEALESNDYSGFAF